MIRFIKHFTILYVFDQNIRDMVKMRIEVNWTNDPIAVVMIPISEKRQIQSLNKSSSDDQGIDQLSFVELCQIVKRCVHIFIDSVY